MSDAAQMSKTASLELSGQTLVFSKINLSIMSDFVNGMQRRTMQQALELLPEAGAAEKLQMLNRLQADAVSANDFDLLKTVDGILYMLWLCSRPHQPELTISELGELVPLADFETLSSFVVTQLLGISMEMEPEAATGEKKGMKLAAATQKSSSS